MRCRQAPRAGRASPPAARRQPEARRRRVERLGPLGVRLELTEARLFAKRTHDDREREGRPHHFKPLASPETGEITSVGTQSGTTAGGVRSPTTFGPVAEAGETSETAA